MTTTNPKAKRPTRPASKGPTAPRRARAAKPVTAAAPSEQAPPSTEADALTSPKGPAGKLGVVVALMRRPEGATVAQMGEATGWQSHSVRGALAGSLKKKHKLAIVSEPAEGGRIYRLAPEAAA